MEKQLPIYNATIDGEYDGIMCISIVSSPATGVDYVLFNKQNELQKFEIQDEEKHLLCSVIMTCEQPIYRRSEEGFEYYIKYTAETIRMMAQKMLKDGTFNNFDTEHNGNPLPYGAIELVELYIKDESKGISPNFIDVPDGSLMCTYKINNVDLWKDVKSGKFNGLSLEGWFGMEEAKYMKQDNKTNKKYSKMSKLKEKLAKLLATFGAVETDKGTLNYEGDELAVGTEVFDGEDKPIADGEYTADGKVYVVKDGKVEEIKDAEKPAEDPAPEDKPAEDKPVEGEEEKPAEDPAPEEEKPAEDPAPEEPNDVEALRAEVQTLREEIEALKAEVEALKNQIAEIINKPAVEPIEEEFSKTVKNDKTKGASRYFEALSK